MNNKIPGYMRPGAAKFFTVVATILFLLESAGSCSAKRDDEAAWDTAAPAMAPAPAMMTDTGMKMDPAVGEISDPRNRRPFVGVRRMDSLESEVSNPRDKSPTAPVKKPVADTGKSSSRLPN